jgi:hypothetical protein
MGTSMSQRFVCGGVACHVPAPKTADIVDCDAPGSRYSRYLAWRLGDCWLFLTVPDGSPDVSALERVAMSVKVPKP